MTDNPTPVEIEASGVDLVKVDYKGRIYAFPASSDDWPYEVGEATDNQKFTHALNGLLSADDLAAFKATKPTMKDAAGLFEAYTTTIGLGSPGK